MTTFIGTVCEWKFPQTSGIDCIGNEAIPQGRIVKFPGGVPSEEEQDAWIIEYENHLKATQYREDRKNEYPSIQDQLDMQYHDLVDGTTTWKDAVDVVKTKYPKP